MTNQLNVSKQMQCEMLTRNYQSLTTTLALLVPWSNFKIADRIDLQSYHSKFNLRSARVLMARLNVFAANLADWEHNHGTPHLLDDVFHEVEDVAHAARMHLLDVPFPAMDALQASGGNVEQWQFGKAFAEGANPDMKLSGLALRPFFITGG